MAANDGEEIVEVVGHAAGEAAQGVHFLRLAELRFELPLFGGVFLEGTAHKVESVGQARHFIMTAGVEWIGVIAAFESLDALDERSERASDGVGDEVDEPAAEENGYEGDLQEQAVQ